MSKSFKEITQHVSKNMMTLSKSVPNTTTAFSGLAQSAITDGVLDKKQKELIALAIAVSQRCDACIGFHIKALIKLGASREEIAETLAVCVYMGGGPSMMYAAEAIAAFEEFSE